MTCEVVIPCYQESTRLPEFLEELAGQLAASSFPAKITIADDGSGQEEVERLLIAIQPIIAAYPSLFREPLLLPQNIGKGGTIYAGWQRAMDLGDSELLAFVDADGSIDAPNFCALVCHLIEQQEHVDAVLGSRVMLLGKTIDRHLSRHLIGRCFATLASTMTGVKVYDSQCGAKVFKREVFASLAPRLQETGFAFDVELILASLLQGYRLVELPLDWREVPGSKVRLFRDVWHMARSIFQIRQRWGVLP